MATVADLYTQVLGRAPDAGGLAYWESLFGSSVDPAELATFKSVAQVTEPERVATVAAAATPTAPARPSTVNDLYQTFYGTPGNAEGLSYWGGADKAVTPKDAASWLLWAGKDPSIANKSTGLTVDQAYETYLGFKPDETARNYWTGGDPNKALTTAELAAITSEAYGLNPKDSGGLLGTGIGPDLSLKQAALLAGAYFGAPVLSGAIGGATGLTGAALSGATGAAIGGTGAALTGNDILKGALTGGALGYGGGLLQEGLSNVDALRADNIDVGGGWNPATGAGDAATAAAAAATGVTSSAYTPHLFTPSGLDVTTGLPTTTVTGNPTTTVTDKITNLTPTDLTNLAKAGVGLTGLLGGAAAVGGLTGGGAGNLNLTQQDRSGVSSGSAQYSPEYYQAIQAKYNQMMPQQPRDVTTDLKSWYETKYAPKVA